jgi:hypothetical protein
MQGTTVKVLEGLDLHGTDTVYAGHDGKGKGNGRRLATRGFDTVWCSKTERNRKTECFRRCSAPTMVLAEMGNGMCLPKKGLVNQNGLVAAEERLVNSPICGQKPMWDYHLLRWPFLFT